MKEKYKSTNDTNLRMDTNTTKAVFGLIAVVVMLGVIQVVYADHAININTADQEALVTLTGIGDVKAQDIIAHREVNGLFASIEEIKEVSGIGDVTFENIKNHITVGGGVAQYTEEQVGSGSQESDTNEAQTTPTPTHTSALSPPADAEVYAHASGERVVTVGVDALFKARATTKSGTPIPGAYFRWSFGDGSMRDGVDVLHRFHYPGTYVVVLDVLYQGSSVQDHLIVEARPANITIEIRDDGALALTNVSGYDIDVSLWQLKMGQATYTLPKYTILLNGKTVIFSVQTTRLNVLADLAELLFPEGEVATSTQDKEAEQKLAQNIEPKEESEAPAKKAVPTASSASASHSGAQAPQVYAPLIAAPYDLSRRSSAEADLSRRSSAEADHFAQAAAITPEEAAVLYGEDAAAVGGSDQIAAAAGALQKTTLRLANSESGDGAGMFTWMGALVVSFIGLTAVAVYRRARRRAEIV